MIKNRKEEIKKYLHSSQFKYLLKIILSVVIVFLLITDFYKSFVFINGYNKEEQNNDSSYFNDNNIFETLQSGNLSGNLNMASFKNTNTGFKNPGSFAFSRNSFFYLQKKGSTYYLMKKAIRDNEEAIPLLKDY